MKTACVAALFLVGIVGCNRSEISRNPLLGQYELVGRDKSGQTVFTGTMSIHSLEQNHLKGKCRIIRSKVAPAGLLDQDATCEGLLEGKA